jgi:hypothetical protein
MAEIAASADLKALALSRFAHDSEFLKHPVGTRLVGGMPGGVARRDVMSPVARDITLLSIREQYAKILSDRDAADEPLAWVGMVLLPVGIALRLVKTSLELFGRLDDS